MKSLMQLMVYIYHWLLLFKNDNLKYTAISQRRSFNSFTLFYIFFLISFFFLLSFFKLSCTKKHHVYNQYHISYTLRFCYAIYYIVLGIYIGRRFLKGSCYSQQIIFVLAKKSLIPYNLTQRAPEIQNL